MFLWSFPGAEFEDLAQKLRDEAAGRDANDALPFADPAIIEVYPPAESAEAEPAPTISAEFFTQSQVEARKRILALGRLYFADTTARRRSRKG
ncbi:MAG: hypothetical protein H7067_08020 [Burkholderiales bacterium]|nr:hypothetical protein [Opitutaceae bacterium]